MNIRRRVIACFAVLAACAAHGDTPATAGGVLMADASKQYPPWDSFEASVERGRLSYEHYCTLCHGTSGKGDGRAARLYNPRPANLITSDKNPAYKELIIRRGGAAVGRSQYMPPWAEELTEEQIADVVNYLGTIVAPRPSGK